MKRLYAIAFLLALITPTIAAAETVPERWHRMSGEASELLKAGQYDKALNTSEKMIREMIDQLGPGEKATEVFGRTVTYKALALAGLGRQDEALWWWHSVLAMYPAFANSDLSTFGKAGEMLTRNSVLTRPGPVKEPQSPPTNVSAPKVLKRVDPQFPAGAHWFGVAGQVEIELVILKDGRLRSPRILRTLPAPTIAYTALDAVRRWKFQPGRMNGEAVDVVFNLTINYKM